MKKKIIFINQVNDKILDILNTTNKLPKIHNCYNNKIIQKNH